MCECKLGLDEIWFVCLRCQITILCENQYFPLSTPIPELVEYYKKDSELSMRLNALKRAIWPCISQLFDPPLTFIEFHKHISPRLKFRHQIFPFLIFKKFLPQPNLFSQRGKRLNFSLQTEITVCVRCPWWKFRFTLVQKSIEKSFTLGLGIPIIRWERCINELELNSATRFGLPADKIHKRLN